MLYEVITGAEATKKAGSNSRLFQSVRTSVIRLGTSGRAIDGLSGEHLLHTIDKAQQQFIPLPVVLQGDRPAPDMVEPFNIMKPDFTSGGVGCDNVAGDKRDTTSGLDRFDRNNFV